MQIKAIKARIVNMNVVTPKGGSMIMPAASHLPNESINLMLYEVTLTERELTTIIAALDTIESHQLSDYASSNNVNVLHHNDATNLHDELLDSLSHEEPDE